MIKNYNYVLIEVGNIGQHIPKESFINGTKEEREELFYTFLRCNYEQDLTTNLRKIDIVDLIEDLNEYLKLQNIVDVEPEICQLDTETGETKNCI